MTRIPANEMERREDSKVAAPAIKFHPIQRAATAHPRYNAPMSSGSITDVGGIRVGHATDPEAGTGCTLFLFEPAARAGMDVGGGAAGLRNVEELRGHHVVGVIDALLFAGGSAFGLAATDGVMAHLEERGVGFATPAGPVPIVPTAILYDLGFGRSDIRPDAAMGRAACEAATADPPAEGSVGAGTGATVGKAAGLDRATKSGFGSASHRRPDGLVVGAAACVNALGEVQDPSTSLVLAGPRDDDDRFLDSMEILANSHSSPVSSNTTLALVATNAYLEREALCRVARQAQDALARTIQPAHTTWDGDVVFAVSTGNHPAPLDAVGVLARLALEDAILRAIAEADGLGRLPAYQDLVGDS